MKFVVITKIRNVLGNLAVNMDLYEPSEEPSAANGYLGNYSRINVLIALNMRTPVFQVGEVLIVDDNGRELPYPGRKPAKWDVETEEFEIDRLGDALACSERVAAEEMS